VNKLSILNSEDSFNQLDDLASIHTIIDEGRSSAYLKVI
jgi:hypothetical protein